MKTISDTAADIALDRLGSNRDENTALALAYRLYWIGAARGAVSAEFVAHKLGYDAYKLLLDIFHSWENWALNQYLNREN